MASRKIPHQPRPCERCKSLFSPLRSDARYCSKLCVLRNFQARQRKPEPEIHSIRSSRNPTYRSFKAMHNRCRNKENERYGRRGISVSHVWDLFTDFLNDMGPRPDGHTIDRIDGDGDYCPENCRWSTQETQSNNRSTTRNLTAFGQTLTVTQWGRKLGIPAPTIFTRLNLGWCPTAALLLKAIKKEPTK